MRQYRFIIVAGMLMCLMLWVPYIFIGSDHPCLPILISFAFSCVTALTTMPAMYLVQKVLQAIRQERWAIRSLFLTASVLVIAAGYALLLSAGYMTMRTFGMTYIRSEHSKDVAEFTSLCENREFLCETTALALPEYSVTSIDTGNYEDVFGKNYNFRASLRLDADFSPDMTGQGWEPRGDGTWVREIHDHDRKGAGFTLTVHITPADDLLYISYHHKSEPR